MANDLVERWLRWMTEHHQDLAASFGPAGAPLAAVASGMDAALALYAVHDGQPVGDGELPPPVYEQYRWMTVAEIAEVREDLDGMAKVGEWDTDTYQRIDWWVPGWVPLLTDDNSNYLCIDTVGSFGGTPGQMIEFIHDDEDRVVFAPTFDAWFAAWTASLEAGAWKRDPEDGWERSRAVDRAFALAMPSFPRAHASTKRKRAPKAAPSRKKATKQKPEPLLGVFKNRMSAAEITEAIDAGASVHARDADGATPLHLAMGCGNEIPALTLIAAGADVNAVNARGETPLHLAALAHQRTAPALIATMITMGADLTMRTGDDQPPIAYASSIEALEALLAGGADPTVTVGGKSLAAHYRYWGRSPAMISRVTPTEG